MSFSGFARRLRVRNICVVLVSLGVLAAATSCSSSAPNTAPSSTELPAASGETAVRPAHDGSPAKYGYVEKLCDALNLTTLKTFANQIDAPPSQKHYMTDPVEGLGGTHFMECSYPLKQDAKQAVDIKHLRLQVRARVDYGPAAVETAHDNYSETSNADKGHPTGLGERAYDTFGDSSGTDIGGRAIGMYALGVLDSNLSLQIEADTTGSFNKEGIAQAVQQLARDLMTSLEVRP